MADMSSCKRSGLLYGRAFCVAIMCAFGTASAHNLDIGGMVQERLAVLEQRPNVAGNVVEAFREGADVVEVYVTVKGFDVDPPFYRTVIDDPPERRRESFERILDLLGEGAASEGVIIEGTSDSLLRVRLTASGGARNAHVFATYTALSALWRPPSVTRSLR